MPGPDVSERMRNEGLPLSCPVLSFSSSSDLIIQVFLGLGGWAYPSRAFRAFEPPRRRAHGEPPTSPAAAVRAGAWPARRPRGSVSMKPALGEGCSPLPSALCRSSRATHPARASSLPSACGSPRPRTSRRGTCAVPRSPACCGSGTPDGRCRPSPRRSRAARRGR